MRRLILFALLALLVPASAVPALAGTPAGDWSGSWSSSMYSESGSLSLTLYPSGSSSWSGTYVITNTAAGTLAGPVSGTTSGGLVTLTARLPASAGSGMFSVYLVTDMSDSEPGNWAIWSATGALYDYGTFRLNRTTPSRVSILASAGTGGSVTPSGTTLLDYAADGPTYAVMASSGYHISAVLVDGVSVGAVTTYDFGRVTSNHTLRAEFARTAPPPVAEKTPNMAPVFMLLLNGAEHP